MSTEGGATPQPADAGRERSGRRAAIIVAVVVLLAAVAYLFCTQGPGERLLGPAGSTVAEFSGTGDEVTDTFSVREGWTIHWENVGSRSRSRSPEIESSGRSSIRTNPPPA